MLSWTAPAFESDRRVARSGRFDVGAVFPPLGNERKWRWRFFLSIALEGTEKTELGAKNALATAWADWLARANLTPADRGQPQQETDVSALKISPEVMSVLDRALIEGNTLSLVPLGTLDRKLYQDVNKVLEAAGGKWDKRAKVHVFPEDAAGLLDPIIATGEYRRVKQDMGQFDTPEALAADVVARAAIQPGELVLEPNAGTGNLVRPALAAGAKVTLWELDAKRAAKLREEFAGQAQVDVVVNGDFLDAVAEPVFDKVLMNPPFAAMADVHHVCHATSFLKPGGRLVAIMSAGVKFRASRLFEAFRGMVESYGGTIEDLPENAFAAAGTGVRTVLVTFTKPADAVA